MTLYVSARILSLARRAIPLLVLMWAACSPLAASATPVKQTLSRPSSSIAFGVDSPSPALTMNGHVHDFSGAVSINPSDNSIAQLQLGINISSAQLPPEQFLQSVFLQSILARFKQSTAGFRSSSVEHIRGDEYVAAGTYSWQNRVRPATIPLRVVHTSPTRSELKVAFSGGLSEASAPSELTSIAPGASQSTGWARATLIFVRANPS